jgi:esterase/lipase superfamily enzyme
MKANRVTLQLALALFLVSTFAATPRAQAPAVSKTQTYDVCARGLNNDPATPFTQTLRVKVSLTGPALDEVVRKPVLAQLIRNTVWSGRASAVFVEDFDETECAASGGNQSEVTAELTQADIDAIRAEVARSPDVIERVIEIAKRAGVRLDQASSTSDAQKRWLRIFYATNRQATQRTDTADAFGSGRSDALSYGAVEVAVLHQKEMRDVESPAVFKFEKATSLEDFAVAGRLVPLSRDEWLLELKRSASRFERPGVLLFIHGYNVTFLDAARRAAQLSYDLAFPGPTVFFAWPSDASTIKYLRDGRDAENSWIAAASVLSDVTGLLPSGPVYVVAHSMGNRVMLGGLARLLDETPGRRRAIKEVVMAAPDVDQESFRLNTASKILNTGPRFTLYASEHDLALGTSEFLQGGNRLGMGGKALFVANGIDSIDASAVTKEFFALNHSYFGDKTVVLSDIFFLIRQALPPEKRPHLQRSGNGLPAAWLLK